MPNTEYQLVADIGGTNARFALIDSSGELNHIKVLTAQRFGQFIDALADYLHSLNIRQVKAAAIAVAAPVHQQTFSFANSHWQINKQQIANHLDCSPLWMNDFAAQALGVSQITQQLNIKLGDSHPTGNKLIIGPGTGLGVAGLVYCNSRWVPIVGEGGHAGFSPVDELAQEVLAILMKKNTYVAWEHLISGNGLPLLYKTVGEILSLPTKLDSAPSITQAAFANNMTSRDPAAVHTMSLFFRQLGHICASAAFIMGATGGIYLTGGILPKVKQPLIDSDFLAAFHLHNSPKNYLNNIPITLNLDELLGLRGAQLALDEQPLT